MRLAKMANSANLVTNEKEHFAFYKLATPPRKAKFQVNVTKLSVNFFEEEVGSCCVCVLANAN